MIMIAAGIIALAFMCGLPLVLPVLADVYTRAEHHRRAKAAAESESVAEVHAQSEGWPW